MGHSFTCYGPALALALYLGVRGVSLVLVTALFGSIAAWFVLPVILPILPKECVVADPYIQTLGLTDRK